MATENTKDKSFGFILREARLAKNVSLQDVSKVTRIHMNILQAIESDDVESLGHVYAKSFLKLYAEYLGVEREEVLRRFAITSGAEDIKSTGRMRFLAEKEKKSAGPVFIDRFFALGVVFLKKINLKVVFLVLCVALIVWGIGKLASHHKKTSGIAAKVEIKKAIVKKAPVAAPVVKAVPPEPPKPIIPEQKAPALTQPTISAETSLQGKADKMIMLVIRAKEKCWIQVKSDGKVVFQSTLVKGASESWQAAEKIELMLGNAGAVQLEINGRLFSKIGRPGQTLKHVVVTRAGFSVRK